MLGWHCHITMQLPSFGVGASNFEIVFPSIIVIIQHDLPVYMADMDRGEAIVKVRSSLLFMSFCS